MVALERKYRNKGLARLILDNIKAHPWVYLMALPVVAYYVIFCYMPMYGVIISFFDYKPVKGILASKWVGLKHFQSFFQSRFFWQLLRNTLSINIGNLLIGFPLPIIFALLLSEIRSTSFRRLTQTITYMPHFVSTVVVCALLRNFSESTGILTYFLGLFGVPRINLLTVPAYFQPLYIGMNIWQELGWESIIFFAALTGLDPALYEAARIDGAGRWKQMWHITIPGISATIIIMFILRMGNLMSLGFDRIILLYTPMVYESADVISTYVYRRGLVEFEYSFAAAVGLFNSVINVILLTSTNLLSRRVSGNSLW